MLTLVVAEIIHQNNLYSSSANHHETENNLITIEKKMEKYTVVYLYKTLPSSKSEWQKQYANN